MRAWIDWAQESISSCWLLLLLLSLLLATRQIGGDVQDVFAREWSSVGYSKCQQRGVGSESSGGAQAIGGGGGGGDGGGCGWLGMVVAL